MKLTKKQKIVFITIIVIISLIIYNMFFRKEHAISINVDEKLELTKIANNIKNTINSDDTTDLNSSNGLILASNVINSIQYLFFIYEANIGLIKINLSTGEIISSIHAKINQPIKVIFKKNGDFVINSNDNKKLYTINTIQKKYNRINLHIDTVAEIQNNTYLRFTVDDNSDTFLINTMIDELNIYLNADIINDNLPSFIKNKIEKYITEYKNSTISEQI